MSEGVSSEAQGWPTPGRSVVSRHRAQRAGKPGLRLVGHLQVLLTGKPCRNFQVLVAYSMLQMVREQVLQESLTSDGILLVRGPWGRASPSPTPTPPTPPMPSQPSGPWQELGCPEHRAGLTTSRMQRDSDHHSSALI